MQISNIRKNENIGFTLVELIIVIAGIAALIHFNPELIKFNKTQQD